MVDLFDIAGQLMDLITSTGLEHLLPRAGVSGAIAVTETVDMMEKVKFTIIFIASLAALFGIGLAMAAQKFQIKIDPRVTQVTDALAHAHCGACGYPGCEQYAEAVVNDADISPALCTPGGARTTEAVAAITGKKAEIKEPNFSRIMCQGGIDKSTKRFIYEGVADCRAAVLAGGGDKSCIYGCLGYGTCVRACPFDALSMGQNGLPVVDIIKCTGCRKCEKACPKNVIEVLPGSKAVLVSCHCRDKGAIVRKNCKVACIACGTCVKVCPYDAPVIENNYSRIQLDKCRVCGLCVTKCPTKAISDYIPVRNAAFITDACIGCHKCAKICPVDAPSGELKKKHEIDQAKCIGCGICTAGCPKQAIDGTFNAKQVQDEAAERKAVREAAKKAAEAA